MTINIGDSYIIMKNNKEQLVTLDAIYMSNGITHYEYNYGYIGFHEGYCLDIHIRELTINEKHLLDTHKFWNLPQQFYQSTPF
jgi:hypothetical protein